MRQLLFVFQTNPFLRLAVYVSFAIVFFYSGLGVTTWLVEPEQLRPIDKILGAFFPVLLPLFFVVNRYFGCGAGGCAGGTCVVPPEGGARRSESR